MGVEGGSLWHCDCGHCRLWRAAVLAGAAASVAVSRGDGEAFLDRLVDMPEEVLALIADLNDRINELPGVEDMTGRVTAIMKTLGEEARPVEEDADAQDDDPHEGEVH